MEIAHTQTCTSLCIWVMLFWETFQGNLFFRVQGLNLWQNFDLDASPVICVISRKTLKLREITSPQKNLMRQHLLGFLVCERNNVYSLIAAVWKEWLECPVRILLFTGSSTVNQHHNTSWLKIDLKGNMSQHLILSCKSLSYAFNHINLGWSNIDPLHLTPQQFLGNLSHLWKAEQLNMYLID